MTQASPSAPMKRTMIAPCGMNCAVCIAHLRTKNHCPGCRSTAAGIPRSCTHCKMRNCRVTNTSGGRYCTSCDEFPCTRLRQLDKRYRTRYGVSLLGNLREIEISGIKKFLTAESERWQCKRCGARLSVHRIICLQCGQPFVKNEFRIIE